MRLLVFALGFLVHLGACQPRVSSVGVLTLAPAGMRASEGCTVGEDKTSLEMPVGGRAMTVAYAPKGTIRAGVAGRSLVNEEIELVVYFDAQRVAARVVGGKTVLEGEEGLWLVVEVPRAGPHSWEFEVRAKETTGGVGPAFRFEKFVISGS